MFLLAWQTVMVNETALWLKDEEEIKQVTLTLTSRCKEITIQTSTTAARQAAKNRHTVAICS